MENADQDVVKAPPAPPAPELPADVKALAEDVAEIVRILRTRFGEFNKKFSVLDKDVTIPSAKSAIDVADERVAAAKSAIAGILASL